MATIVSAGGSLTTTPNTAIESTAFARHIGVTLFNTSSTDSRKVTVRVGTQIVWEDYIEPRKNYTVGPHSVGSAETLQAWQETGTDVVFRVSGEY